MNQAIIKCSKFLLIAGMFISVKVNAQDLALIEKRKALQEEYAITVSIVENDQPFAIFPSSVKKNASIVVNAEQDGWAVFQIKAKCGKTLLEQQMSVTKGVNKIPVFFISGVEKGVYTTALRVEDKVYFAQLVKE